MTRSIPHFLVCMMLSFHAVSGQDTTFLSKKLNLNEIIISASRKSESSPIFQIQRIDSVSLSEKTLTLNLASLLQQSIPVNLTSYGGKGSLTSIRLRGSGSNHTQINWNGIPVNSITAGSADIAQFLPGLFDRIEVISGASGSVFGSGTFGGAINLENQPVWEQRLQTLLYSEFGSWHHWLNGMTTRMGNEKLQYHISGVIQRSDNTYSYDNTFKPGNPREFRVNDTLDAMAWQQNLFWKLPSSVYLQAGTWHQRMQKDVPTAMSMTTNRLGSQDDNIFRIYFRVKKYFERAYAEGQTSWSRDQLAYSETIREGGHETIKHSLLRTNRWISTALFRHYIKPALIAEAGGESDLQKAISGSYATTIQEVRGSLFTRLEYRRRSLMVQGAFRLEFTPYMGVKPLYSMGVSKQVNQSLDARFLISNKFRTPTLNERYWNPGGNMELKPEYGHGFEAGLTYKKDMGKVRLKSEGNLFLQNIHDWIQWVPSGPLWAPQNVRFVSCRGGDLHLHALLPMGESTLLVFSSITYTESLDMHRVGIENRRERQLAYVPLWMGTTTMAVDLHRWSGGVDYRYTGQRYSTDDHDVWLILPPAHMIDLHTSCLLVDREVKVFIKMRIENLLNINYQWIRGYPSPGRGIYLSLVCNFRKHQK